jgi:GT2 family glycosyltransferase
MTENNFRCYWKFLNTDLTVRLVPIDNSPTDDLKDVISDSRAEYIHNPSNPGYGSTHNIAIRQYSDKQNTILF